MQTLFFAMALVYAGIALAAMGMTLREGVRQGRWLGCLGGCIASALWPVTAVVVVGVAAQRRD